MARVRKNPPTPKDTGEVKKLIERYKRAAESFSPTRGTEMLRLSTEIHERVAAITRKESQDDE